MARVLAEDAEGEALPREAIAAAIHEIQTLDSSVSTGNAALDTALTEKRLLCAHEGITLTCMVDGMTLSAMDTSDLYALACGLIDEAMEAVRSCKEGNRSISISVKRVGGMAHIHVEHDGMSGQPGEVDAIVGHYDGVVTRGSDGDAAFVNALIPIP
ncbi:MAG: GHKL domain-containing protein [Atopobiaceae bacterium]|nr:GHKL domain-containing protein [Atopobiaceae bacterium]